MLCSKCSETVTPVVAIDIDGTLGDYHNHFIDFATDYFAWESDQMWYARAYNGDGSFRTWVTRTTEITDQQWHEVKLAYRQGGMKRTMPIKTGAQALCWAVKDAGAELWITTTRPYLSLDNIVPDTVEWLRRNEIKYDGMLFDELKYEQFAQRIDTTRVVAVLDDLQEMCEAAAAALHYGNDVPILIRNNWNSAMRWPVTAHLDGATDIVLDRIEWWRHAYA
jgi:hypothetical protein